MAVDAGGCRDPWKRGSTGRLRHLSCGPTEAAFVAEQDGRIRRGPKGWNITESTAEWLHAQDKFSRRQRRTRSPLAKNPCGWHGTRRRKGRNTLALVTAKRSQAKGKHRRAWSFLPANSLPQRCVLSYPASGQKLGKWKGPRRPPSRLHRRRYFLASELFLDHWIPGPWGKSFVALKGFHGQLDCLFELRVMASDNEIGPLRYNVVGIHSVIFHDPFAAIVG